MFGGHLHQHLVGGVRVKIDGLWTYKNRTALAGVYPPKLCLGWARVGAFLAPTGSHGKLGWRRTNDFISALSEAAGCSEFQTAETAKRHTGESRTGEAARGRDPLREAARFIKEHPVVFGQFTKEDIDRLEFKRQNLKTNQTTC